MNSFRVFLETWQRPTIDDYDVIFVLGDHYKETGRDLDKILDFIGGAIKQWAQPFHDMSNWHFDQSAVDNHRAYSVMHVARAISQFGERWDWIRHDNRGQELQLKSYDDLLFKLNRRMEVEKNGFKNDEKAMELFDKFYVFVKRIEQLIKELQ